MASLEEKLAEVKAGFKSQAPPEAQKLIAHTTQALTASGQHERALGVGSQFPSFDLADANGQPLRSSALLEKGPIVVSFFRGFW